MSAEYVGTLYIINDQQVNSDALYDIVIMCLSDKLVDCHNTVHKTYVYLKTQS